MTAIMHDFWRGAKEQRGAKNGVLSETRGQWPYRPALKERAMTNRPIIPYNFKLFGLHVKKKKSLAPSRD